MIRDYLPISVRSLHFVWGYTGNVFCGEYPKKGVTNLSQILICKFTIRYKCSQNLLYQHIDCEIISKNLFSWSFYIWETTMYDDVVFRSTLYLLVALPLLAEDECWTAAVGEAARGSIFSNDAPKNIFHNGLFVSSVGHILYWCFGKK